MSRKTAFFLLVLLGLVGLADALYLTYDHGAFHADPSGYGGGLCGADGGCSISRSSIFSEIPLPGAELGLPTSVLALGFYVVFLTLVVLRARAQGGDALTRLHGDGEQSIRSYSRLLLALAVLANLYSLFLLGYSLAEGSVCKFCVGLYVVNAGLLYVTWKSLGEPVGAAVKSIGGVVLSRAGAIAAVVMVVALAAGYFVYRGSVMAAVAKNAAAAPTVVNLDTTNRPHKGPADAPVHLVELADFECPHCKLAFEIVEEILAERQDLRVTFMHFPLDMACNPLVDRPMHERACELAMIGECAHQQGKFFEAAPILFEGAPTPDIKSKLMTKGVDLVALDTCLAAESTKVAVGKDIKAGLDAKIQGTPALFLNGAQVGGALPKDKLMQLIDGAKAVFQKSTHQP